MAKTIDYLCFTIVWDCTEILLKIFRSNFLFLEQILSRDLKKIVTVIQEIGANKRRVVRQIPDEIVTNLELQDTVR